MSASLFSGSPLSLVLPVMGEIKASELSEIVYAGRRAYEAGLAPGRLASLGMRLSSGLIAVTSREAALGFLKNDDVVLMDEKGRLKGNMGRVEPCDDAGIMRAVLNVRKDAFFVLKSCSPFATALSFAPGKVLDAEEELFSVIGGLAFVSYYRPGTTGLAGAVADALRERSAALLEKQGAVVCGKGVQEVLDAAEALEHIAKVAFILKSNDANIR